MHRSGNIFCYITACFRETKQSEQDCIVPRVSLTYRYDLQTADIEQLINATEVVRELYDFE